MPDHLQQFSTEFPLQLHYNLYWGAGVRKGGTREQKGLWKQTQCPRGNSRQVDKWGYLLCWKYTSITCLSLSRYKKELDCSIWVRKSGKKLKRKRKKEKKGGSIFKDFVFEKIQVYCLLDSILNPLMC